MKDSDRSARSCSSRCGLVERRAPVVYFFFFLNDAAPPDIYPLPLHAALPIWGRGGGGGGGARGAAEARGAQLREEHAAEAQGDVDEVSGREGEAVPVPPCPTQLPDGGGRG